MVHPTKNTPARTKLVHTTTGAVVHIIGPKEAGLEVAITTVASGVILTAGLSKWDIAS